MLGTRRKNDSEGKGWKFINRECSDDSCEVVIQKLAEMQILIMRMRRVLRSDWNRGECGGSDDAVTEKIPVFNESHS